MQITAKTIRIVSRKSRLALLQAGIVQQQLQQLYPELQFAIIGVSTSGDEILDQPLNKIGGKGLFVKELEHHLLDNRADIAVHSMKDVPSVLPLGLKLSVILPRADPRDVICSTANYDIHSLPIGARIGSSSLRRQAQLLALRDDLQISSLRGNVETRINKLLAEEYDAIVLAAAGLQRLGLEQWLRQPLTVDQMLPAVGQGALGIEQRKDDNFITDLLRPLNDAATLACVTAEREMNKMLDAGCQAPVAGFAQIINNRLELKGLVATADGAIIYQDSYADEISNCAMIGRVVAESLIAQGAAQIIADLKTSGQLYD